MSKSNKNKEANVMNISAKFQLHHPKLASEEKIFEYFFANLAFWLPWQPIKFSGLDKFICLVEDYSRNITLKFCQNICNVTLREQFTLDTDSP